MTQAQTQGQAPTNSSTNGAGESKAPKQVTAIEAIQKITKILDQLSSSDRKRVLAFVNDNESNPSNA